MKVYLDHANWIRVSRDPALQSQFESLVDSTTVSSVLSLIHLVELAQSTPDSVSEVLELLDRLAHREKLIWIRGLTAVVQDEVKAALLTWLRQSTSPVDPFRSSFPEVLSGRMSYYNLLEAKTFTPSKLVELVRRSDGLKEHRAFRQRYPNIHNWSRSTRVAAGDPRFGRADVARLISEDVPERIETLAGIECQISQDERTRFAQQLDVSSCPALRVKIAFLEGWNLSNNAPKPSELEDNFHLVGSAYCDVAFADKRTVDILKRGGIKKLPSKNAEFEGWLRSL